jgi:hypothetical protein
MINSENGHFIGVVIQCELSRLLQVGQVPRTGTRFSVIAKVLLSCCAYGHGWFSTPGFFYRILHPGCFRMPCTTRYARRGRQVPMSQQCDGVGSGPSRVRERVIWSTRVSNLVCGRRNEQTRRLANRERLKADSVVSGAGDTVSRPREFNLPGFTRRRNVTRRCSCASTSRVFESKWRRLASQRTSQRQNSVVPSTRMLAGRSWSRSPRTTTGGMGFGRAPCLHHGYTANRKVIDH